jgi:acetylornithine/N-succinyldiaminopimelate aminotransferase
MTAGAHGSTFGGNPLAMAVGNAVMEIVSQPAFLEHVRRMGLYLKQRLAALVDSHSAVVAEVRGEGLLVGLRCVAPVADVLAALRDQGLLAAGAGENVLRLLPPLIVGEAEIDAAVTRLDAAVSALEHTRKQAAE